MDVVVEHVGKIADEVAQKIAGELFWYCQISHFLLVIYGVKQSWNPVMAKSQPVLTLVLSMICCFGGGILVKLLVGEKPLSCFDDNTVLLAATAVWWLVFYFPFNLVCRSMQNTLVSCILILFKELLRSRKVLKGVAAGADAYPSSLISPIILGVVASCGGSFLKSSANLFNCQWTAKSMASYRASMVTRCCIFFAIIHVLFANALIPTDHLSHNVIALIQAFVVYFISVIQKYSAKFDPSDFLESAFIYVFITIPENILSVVHYILSFITGKSSTKAKAVEEAEAKKKN